jgi:hypothetical protein
MIFDRVQSFAEDVEKLKGTAREKLKLYAVNIIKFLSESDDFFHILMREIMHMETAEQERITQYIRTRIAEISEILTGIIRTDIRRGRIKNMEPEIITSAFNGMMRDVSYRCIIREKIEKSLEELAELIISIIFDGISKNKRKDL